MAANKRRLRNRTRVAIGVTLLAGLAAACAPETNTHGVLPDKALISEIKPGVSSREDVTRILGTPSTVAAFDKETWYYIGARTEQVAFFQPDVLEHKVLVVHFDKAGKVEDVRDVDATKAPSVEFVDRVTPTRGRELTILQQLIGNVGRFNNKGPGAK
jgi:outer membrane protein assembly factor BamE (lipoprotein component of BamABCDE complex)